MLEPALDVLNRALQGDDGARSFIDRTSSIYVLDATNPAKPHTYGCWNFIHQAMNEVERAEGNSPRQSGPQPSQFVPHVQLLATMAIRVARRSNEMDKKLLETCISNSGNSNENPQEAQKLIDINVEIRDIVMGRLAALALDPSFHQKATDSSTGSAFADAVVLEIFCGVLAANAVSNGPAAIQHLVSEWIVPSSNSLPPFCLTCITLHLAEEASRRSAPAGTQDMLQQLSSVAVAGVLAPVLLQAVKESSTETQMLKNLPLLSGMSAYDFNNRIAGLCLRALKQWCKVTDLSLAQIKHVCHKVQINLVDVLNDAMYSDSPMVVDALAELVEYGVGLQLSAHVSEERMTQVRYIMQVDEEAFRSSITAEQLLAIETKEMAVIIEELESSVGLQRFRFVDRQAKGDHAVCRNLARIAAGVCSCCLRINSDGNQISIGPGLLDILIKAAGHPMVDISGIALEVLVKLIVPASGLSHQLLPVLQGRAIAPHQFVNGTTPSIVPKDGTAVDFSEFERFRENLLKDALVACWKAYNSTFMASCTAAVEEFCSPTASIHVSFHLEAAIFCLAAVSEEVVNASEVNSIPHLEKVIRALSSKPESLFGNPLTLAQACKFLDKYATILSSGRITGALEFSSDLALSTFNLCATNYPNQPAALELKREGDISPFHAAAQALKSILCEQPAHFSSTQAIAILGAGWENSYAAANRANILAVEDREALCQGICVVLGALPENQRTKSLWALAMPALDCLETMLHHAQTATSSKNTNGLELLLNRISSEITIIATMARSFAMAQTSRKVGDSADHIELTDPAVELMARGWPSMTALVESYSNHESISKAVCLYAKAYTPLEIDSENKVTRVREIGDLMYKIIQFQSESSCDFILHPVFTFLETFLGLHENVLESFAKSKYNVGDTSESTATPSMHVGEVVERLILSLVDRVKDDLGSSWSASQHQGNGEAAFESKTEPSPTKASSSELLSSIFMLLTQCIKHCPILLFHLPTTIGQDYRKDPLIRRAVETAMVSVSAYQSPEHVHAIHFLQHMVELRNCPVLVVQTSSIDFFANHHRRLLKILLSGLAGKFSSSSLDSAAVFLQVLLNTMSQDIPELRASIVASLKDDFSLGEQGGMTIVEHLVRCSNGHSSVDPVFLQDLWELYQVESTDVLPYSDSVARFCRKYR